MDESKRGQMVSAKTVYDKLVETSKRDDFRDEDVKIILLDDVVMDSNTKYVLHTKDMMTMSEALEKFKISQV